MAQAKKRAKSSTRGRVAGKKNMKRKIVRRKKNFLRRFFGGIWNALFFAKKTKKAKKAPAKRKVVRKTTAKRKTVKRRVSRGKITKIGAKRKSSKKAA